MRVHIPLLLKPTQTQADALRETMNQVNLATNLVIEVGRDSKVRNPGMLHPIVYDQIRNQFNLPAQHAVLLLTRVSDCFSHGAFFKQSVDLFSPIPFDDRILSFDGAAISIRALQERLHIPFSVSDQHKAALRYQQGGSWLMFDNENWFLVITINTDLIPLEKQPQLIHACLASGCRLGARCGGNCSRKSPQLSTTSEKGSLPAGKGEI